VLFIRTQTAGHTQACCMMQVCPCLATAARPAMHYNGPHLIDSLTKALDPHNTGQKCFLKPLAAAKQGVDGVDGGRGRRRAMPDAGGQLPAAAGQPGCPGHGGPRQRRGEGPGSADAAVGRGDGVVGAPAVLDSPAAGSVRDAAGVMPHTAGCATGLRVIWTARHVLCEARSGATGQDRSRAAGCLGGCYVLEASTVRVCGCPKQEGDLYLRRARVQALCGEL